MTSQTPAHGHLLELTPEECWELVATSPVGRLAWQGPHSPTVVPVNFVVDGRSIRVRTTGYSELGRQVDDSAVAFQVDDIDAEGRTGWSVLMRGEAHLEYGSAAAGVTEPEPWLSGPRTLRLRIDVEEVTGRRIVARD